MHSLVTAVIKGCGRLHSLKSLNGSFRHLAIFSQGHIV